VKKFLIVCALSLGAWGLLGADQALAAVSPVEGYAWSSNVGWISFSCKDSISCGTSNYGVNLDRDSGALSGYAWNSAIGWISFNAGDMSGCPVSPCPAKVENGVLTGWAKVINGSSAQGWEGWIHLSGPSYTTSFDGLEFTGYSWSDDVIGWMKWNPAFGPGVYSEGGRNLTTGLSGGGNNSDVKVGETNLCDQGTCVYSYEDGISIDLVANPGDGYMFDTWTGGDVGDCSVPESRICSKVLMDADKEIRAVFKVDPNPPPPPAGPQCNDCIDNDGDGKADWLDDPDCSGPGDQYEDPVMLDVTVVVDSGSGGKVVSTPAGIDCGEDCSKEYDTAETVTLTALPFGSNSTFLYWAGDCEGDSPVCELTMTASHQAEAYFGEVGSQTLFVEIIGDNGGEGAVFSTGDEISCEPECTAVFEFDTVVSLIAEPAPGSTFWEWQGACSGKVPQCAVTMDGTKEVVARFGIGPPPEDECPAGGVGICPQCNDGEDNDGDGFTDFPLDPECGSALDNNESATGANCPTDGPSKCPQCNDGVDNADPEDSLADYPDDKGCFSYADNSEVDPKVPDNCPEGGPGLCPQCSDGIDNDKDGKADWAGLDTDADGTIDVQADPSCQGDPNKNNEAAAVVWDEI